MQNNDYILGINYGAHDTSIAVIKNQKLVFVSEEERFNKDKHTRKFPIESIKYFLKSKKLNLDYFSKILLSFEPSRCINELFIDYSINNQNAKFFKENLFATKKFFFLEEKIKEKLKFKNEIIFVNHHISHILSSLIPSGFKRCICLCFDGVGDKETGALAVYDKQKINIVKKYDYPNSLGLIYSAITDFLGWKHHCDEGIIMGLASYGDYNAEIKKTKKTYLEIFRQIIKSSKKDPLNFEINKKWITFHYERNTWVSSQFKKFFGKKRKKNSEISQHHKNIAAALQKRLEEIVIRITKQLIKEYKIKDVCISGGVGLNCSLNGKILNLNEVNNVFVQPASNDAGTSYGAALYSLRDHKGRFKNNKKNNDFNLGKEITNNEIKCFIKKNKRLKASYMNYDDLAKKAAFLLSEGKVLAWVQGKNEFGPRALGNRSILAKPYPLEMKDRVNRIKKREQFRPFAPAVLDNYQLNYFKMKQSSFHMLYAFEVKKSVSHLIPATVHVDNTSRVQTVNKKLNQKFYKLLFEFHKITDCPVLLNTSLNIKGQPMINNMDEAVKCLLMYDIDYLIINNYLISK